MSITQIINGKIVLPQAVISGNIEIENSQIKYIGNSNSGNKAEKIIDATDKFVLPGFIDIHTNGIAGFDLTNGVYNIEKEMFEADKSVYMDGLEKALQTYMKTGNTRVILTSLAAPIDQIKQIFSYIKEFKNSGLDSPIKTVLAGLFVEGTFMRLEDFKGAHNPDYFNQPSIELFNELQSSSGGLIKIVNVVPEWGLPAIELIRYLASKGLICAAGHTGATGSQYEEAIKNGLSLAVHFLNGPTGSSSKPFEKGGAVETVLRSDIMSLEIIVDGYHVDKSYVRDTIKRKGFEKVAAITDSMFAAEMPGLKDFEVFGIKGKVGKNGEYLQVADSDSALFGSKLTMDRAFANLLTWLTTPINGIWNPQHEANEVDEALIKTVAMCSNNPAKILGIYDTESEATGSLEEGKQADVIITEINKNNDKYELKISDVFVKGNKVL